MNPSDIELWDEDLRWSLKLLKKKENIRNENLLGEQKQLKEALPEPYYIEEDETDESEVFFRRTVVNTNIETSSSLSCIESLEVHALSEVPADFVLMRD